MNPKHLSFRICIVSCALAGCAGVLPARAAGSAPAAKPSRQENIGVVSGLAVGALAGGPVGAIVGATAGAWLGDRYHRQKQSTEALAHDLSSSEAERARLALHTDAVGLDVQFRTGDDRVDPRSLVPLMKLATLAASVPGSVIRVAGFADPRGADGYNEALSLRRAQNVAAALSGAGVPQQRIIVEAYGSGEATAVDGDLDGYALERRVSVRIELPPAGKVARRE